MTVKSVLVRLRGDNGDLNRALLGSAAASKVLGKNLDDADKSSRSLSDALDTSNDRTTMLVQSALALGPALVPIGAQAVPIIAGLATQAVFAAAGVGSVALAFSGVGDTLKAVNAYALDPSAASFAKMSDELDKLGPAGRDFVLYLQELRPRLQELQNVAQEGLLPGAEEGIDAMLEKLPELENLVGTVSTTLGDLLAQGGKSLAGPDFAEFFAYLESDAKPMLTDMGHIVGNFVQTFTNMVVAFGPLTSEFSGGFLQMSKDVEQWSRGLDESTGFQDLVSYIEDTGPEVWSTLGALSSALLAIVAAAAPVGRATLPVIEAIANTLAAVANSPAGPVLIGAAAGLSAVSRAIALYKVANGSALLGVLSKLGPEGTAAGVGARAAGAGLGVLALSMTDIDDKAGLTNTAMFAMLGTLGGPWGAALGAAAGAFLDFKAAGDEVHDDIARWDKALAANATNFGKQADIIAEATAKRDQLQSDINNDSLFPALFSTFDPQEIANGFANVFGDSLIQQNRDEVDKLTAGLNANREAASALGTAYGVDLVGPMSYSQVETGKLADVLDRAKPAMDALGYSFADLAAMSPRELDGVVQQLADWTAYADTGTGKTAALAGAFQGLDNDLYSTAAAADQLKAALDALLSPQMGLSEATDAWTTALRHLDDDLAKNRTLEGGSDAAIKNRGAIRDRVDDMTALLVAQAKAGASSAELSRNMRRQREALIDAGKAAGFSREELRGYLHQMGLTPKLIRTIIKANTDEAADNVSDLQHRFEKLTGVKWTAHVAADVAQARAAIGGVSAALSALHDKNIHVRVFTDQGMGPMNQAADGGAVPKTGLPYADRHLYLLADGEEVISNRYGQADRYRADRAAGLIPGYADGGEVSRFRAHQQSSAPVRAASGPSVTHMIERVVETLPRGRVTAHIKGFGDVAMQFVQDVSREEIEAERRFQANRSATVYTGVGSD